MNISIIGAGVSGLSCAFHLDKLARESGKELEINIFEKNNKPGGLISTLNEDGFIIEEGADSFITSKPWALEICRDIGLEKKLIKPNYSNRRTFVYFDNKLNVLPDGFFLMAPSNLKALSTSNFFSDNEKERILSEQSVPKRGGTGDESIDDFVSRRFGKELLEKVAKPLIGGIYTGDTKKLSMNAVLPEFVEMEEMFGSVIKGLENKYIPSQVSGAESGARYGLFVSLENGMITLIEGIVDSIPEVNFCYNCDLKAVSRGEGKWILKDISGNEYISDRIVLAVPTHVASKLIKDFDPDFSNDLKKIESASSVVANIAVVKEDAANFPEGFGIVVPPSEKLSILACSFTSRKFSGRSKENYELVRCFAGGALNPDLVYKNDNEIRELLLKELNIILNTDIKPVFIKIKKYFDAMPQYNMGYLEITDKIDRKVKELKTLSVAGSAYGGVGIPDCIKSGQNAAEHIFKSLDSN